MINGVRIWVIRKNCVGSSIISPLQEVDVSKIKPGDKVWVEYEIYGGDSPFSGIHFRSKHPRLMDDVVAHFPAEQKYCECKEPQRCNQGTGLKGGKNGKKRNSF